ncbi:uncharacterized protein TM35_000351700 [Trypanosoma theileri]|uniref:Uncharacterized protein n=1 Tax=Trypanosoma theileri TaxID=67003 RepID=A0A1X0NL43_9TRYP|nr:uncharacterized protein TM35_000351700 [Trypanosoma theileri]ORC85426.1 hypothetical protein TM35_000351700 [Trypanosoma theileri]
MKGKQQVTKGSESTSLVTKETTKGEALPLILPIWHFITVELLIYLLCHLASLGLILFTAGDVPFVSPRGGLLQQHRRLKPRPGETREAFDVFRGLGQAGSPASLAHQISADLVLTLVLWFSANGFFLVFIRRIDGVLANEKMRQQTSGNTETKIKENDEKSGENKKGTGRGFLQVECHTFLKDTIVVFSVILSIVIPICVISQPSNEVRSVGPVVVMLTAAANLCMIQVQGNSRGAQTFLNLFQALILIALVVLVAQANVFAYA